MKCPYKKSSAKISNTEIVESFTDCIEKECAAYNIPRQICGRAHKTMLCVDKWGSIGWVRKEDE
jgi:hypothetical protein